MSPQFSAGDIEKLLRKSDLDRLEKLAECTCCICESKRNRLIDMENLKAACKTIGEAKAMKRGFSVWPRYFKDPKKNSDWAPRSGPIEICDRYGFGTGRYFL